MLIIWYQLPLGSLPLDDGPRLGRGSAPQRVAQIDRERSSNRSEFFGNGMAHRSRHVAAAGAKFFPKFSGKFFRGLDTRGARFSFGPRSGYRNIIDTTSMGRGTPTCSGPT